MLSASPCGAWGCPKCCPGPNTDPQPLVCWGRPLGNHDRPTALARAGDSIRRCHDWEGPVPPPRSDFKPLRPVQRRRCASCRSAVRRRRTSSRGASSNCPARLRSRRTVIDGRIAVIGIDGTRTAIPGGRRQGDGIGRGHHRDRCGYDHGRGDHHCAPAPPTAPGARRGNGRKIQPNRHRQHGSEFNATLILQLQARAKTAALA